MTPWNLTLSYFDCHTTFVGICDAVARFRLVFPIDDNGGSRQSEANEDLTHFFRALFRDSLSFNELLVVR